MAGIKGKSGRKANERPIAHMLAEKLAEVGPNNRRRMSNVLDKLVELAEEGDLGATREIFDRLEGKPKQRSEVSGPDGGAIPVTKVEWTIVGAQDED